MTAPSVPAGDVAKLVEELRDVARRGCGINCSIEGEFGECAEAADLLESLSRDLADARAALEPFANAIRNRTQVQYLTADGWIGDLTQEARHARSILSTQPKETPDVA